MYKFSARERTCNARGSGFFSSQGVYNVWGQSERACYARGSGFSSQELNFNLVCTVPLTAHNNEAEAQAMLHTSNRTAEIWSVMKCPDDKQHF